MATPIGRSHSRLGLRTKATGIALLITCGSLIAVATTGIGQIHRQVAAAQQRSVDSVAFGFARASELALNSGDARELTRLGNSFLRDGDLLFIAAYRAGSDQPIAAAVRDRPAFENYQSGNLDAARCVTGVSLVESTSDPTQIPHRVGRVVVGLSTGPARVALWMQIRATVVVTATSAGIGSLVLFITLGAWLRRLDRLSAASQAISRGDFEGEMDQSASEEDEIGRLAGAFDRMRKALRERDGRLRHFTETLQQQVQQRTADLQKALGDAKEASRTKSLFLANMSHELRTPLNGVIGMVDLLLQAQPNPQQRRYCDIAKASARSLLELINDILDFSKIEAGKLELDPVDFDLHEAIDDVVQILGVRASEKNLCLTCENDPRAPRWVYGDPVRFRQVLMNLVSNAVKFTQAGSVSVTTQLISETCTEAVLRFSVKDTGIGIPRDRMNRLFQSFSQIDASTTRKFGGTGLGLAISQRIVEMMDGQIGVESEEGEGSTFWFTASLPKREGKPDALKRECDDNAGCLPDRSLAGIHVLLAEDNEVNQLVATELLQMAGCSCEVVINGRQAVEATLRGDEHDVILMDCQMPEIDGFEATRLIREAEIATPGRRRVIIALTANAIKGDRERCIAAGMDGYVTKPIDPQELFDTIRTLVKCVGTTSAIQVELPQVSPPINVSELQRRCLGNRKVAANVLNKFDQSLDSYLQAIRQGLSQQDMSAIAATAHKIKGAAGNVSATRVRQIASDLEQLVKQDGLTQLDEPLEKLRQEIQSVRAYLDTAMSELTLAQV